MSDLRTLLSDAAPSPAPFSPEDVRTRVGRRRRRRVVGTSVAAVAVLAVVGVVAVATDSPETSNLNVVDEPTTAPVVPVIEATDVAVGHAGLWTVAGNSAVRLDPVTREVTDFVSLPYEVDHVLVGETRVWAWAVGHEAPGGAIAIEVGAGAPGVLGSFGFADGASPVGAAVLPDDSLWLIDAGGFAVRLLPHATVGWEAHQVQLAARPTSIVATVDRQVWVTTDDGNVVSVSTSSEVPTSSYPWSAPLLAARSDGSVWTTDGSRLVALSPAVLGEGLSVAVGERIDVDAGLVSVDAGGIWVCGSAGLQRFPAGSPEATVTHPEIARMASDGTTLWYVDGDGHLDGWPFG